MTNIFEFLYFKKLNVSKKFKNLKNLPFNFFEKKLCVKDINLLLIYQIAEWDDNGFLQKKIICVAFYMKFAMISMLKVHICKMSSKKIAE